MTKPKRISIGTLESTKKKKFSSTLPASAIRIDNTNAGADGSANEGQSENLGSLSTMKRSPSASRSANEMPELVPNDDTSPSHNDNNNGDSISNSNKQEEEMPQDMSARRMGNDEPPAVQTSEPAELPVAEEVNDDLLPQAFVLDDDDLEALSLPTLDPTEKKPTNEKNRQRCSWKVVALLLAFALFVTLLSVGLTGGFQPETPLPPSPPPNEPSESFSSDDPPPYCAEIEPADMVYQGITDIETMFCNDDKCWEQAGPTITAPVDTHFGDFLSISTVSDDKIRFAVSSIKEAGYSGDDSGVVRVYELSKEGNITQVGRAIEGTMEEGDARGFTSGNGHVVAIGMPTSSGPYDVKNGGGWFVLEYDDVANSWIQVGDAVHGNQKQSRLGHAMSLSHDGSIIAIGAPLTDDKMGQVVVYRFDNSTGYRQWTQLGQTMYARERHPNDMFGADLDLSADGLILAVGQRSHDKSKQGLESRGRIAIYRFMNDSWELMGDETLGEESSDAFGRSVGLSTDGKVFVGGVNGDYPYGTSSNNRTAHARAFAFNEENDEWNQLGGDIIGNASPGGNVLNKVALSADGNRIALTTQRIRGAGGGNSQVFEYDKNMDEWRPLGGVIDQSWQTDEHGGTIALSADGNVVIVGAPADNQDGTVRLYRLVDKK